MSLQPEREREEAKGSRGPGVVAAVAAVGVGLGVGAALYYLFNKSEPEIPQAHSTTNSHQTSIQNRLDECSICCELALEVDEACKRLTCGHVFHVECIDPWMQEHNTCPNCRKTV